MRARPIVLSLLLALAGTTAATAGGATWKDAAGSTFSITSTPGQGGEIRGTITMAVAPAPGCNAVGVATPFIGYAHTLPKMAQVIIVNWTAPGCQGVTAWIGTFHPNLDFVTQWTYVDHANTITGTDTWVHQRNSKSK